MHPDTDLEWLTKECGKAVSFSELAALALAELRKFSDGCEIVCGPITTGGRGSMKKKFKVFRLTVQALAKLGKPMFSQLPYEEQIFFLRKRWQEADSSRINKYCMPILEEFYHPLISTGVIRAAWFIPGWESSFGAEWEQRSMT